MAGLSRPQFQRVLPVVAQMAVSDVKKNFAGGHAPNGAPWKALAHGRPSGGSAKPLRDKGLLMASVTGRAITDGVAVGSNLAYARLHNEGGTVTAKRTKFLAIPLTKEVSRAGSPRRFPSKLVSVIGKGGKSGVLIDPVKNVAHYALTKSVRIPKREFLGFSAGLLNRVGRLVADEIIKNAGA